MFALVIKRLLILCLSFWLMAATTAAALPGHCDARDGAMNASAEMLTSDHCADMAMGEMTPDTPENAPQMPMDHDSDALCCCAVATAAIQPLTGVRLSQSYVLQRWAAPLSQHALSSLPVPEPPPPRA